jgi:hypothetical protein
LEILLSAFLRRRQDEPYAVDLLGWSSVTLRFGALLASQLPVFPTNFAFSRERSEKFAGNFVDVPAKFSPIERSA